MAIRRWYVTANRTKVNWASAVVSGVATTRIYELVDNPGTVNDELRVWAAQGQPVSAQKLLAAQDAESADAVPTRHTPPKASGGSQFALARSTPMPRRAPRPRVAVLDNMTAGWGWLGAKVVAAQSNLTFADGVLGSTCLKVVSDGAGASYAAVEKGDLSFTMSGKGMVLWVKAPDLTNIGKPSVYIADNAMTTGYVADSPITPWDGVRFWRAGEWMQVLIPWSRFAVWQGSPSRSGTFTKIRVLLVDKQNGQPAEWRLGGIGTYDEAPEWPNGVVSLTFDDNSGSQWTHAAPRLARYGFTGTLFPVVEALGSGSNLTVAQVKALHEHGGWEIGAHAFAWADHGPMNEMSSAQRVDGLQRLRKWQDDNGLVSSAFAWPWGRANLAAEQDVAKFYSVARGTQDGVEAAQGVSRPTYVRSLAVSGTSTSLATMTALVDQAKSGKAHACFTFHSITAGGTESNSISQANFNSLIDYIAAQGVPVRTFSEAVGLPRP